MDVHRSLVLAILSVTATFAGMIVYAARVGRGANQSATVVGGGLLGGLGLSSAATAWSILGGGPHVAVLVVASVPWLIAPALLFLHAQRKVPLGGITVRVGDRLPKFEALRPDMTSFDSTSLSGKRWLLKFFRGEWCPFCQAELERFDAMGTELQRHGVSVFALSKDSPEAAARHRERDGLRLQLLCDPDLAVIRRFGLEHKKAMEISDGPRIRLFGRFVGTRPVYRHMAAPTTLLVDEQGVIRWIDQTGDYKVRSEPERVLGAIEEAFGPGRRPPQAFASRVSTSSPSHFQAT